MEKIKIDNFVKEYPGCHFPEFTSLDKDNCTAIYEKISKKLGLATTSDGLALVKTIDARQKTCPTAEGIGEQFSFTSLLTTYGLKGADNVYVNWYRYDRIDKLKFSDLDKYFLDIWYPGVDDMDVFDDTLDWIISVSHDSKIKLLKL
jgi:hypothetical protein